MKSFLKVFCLLSFCLVASVNLASCSSGEDGEEVIESSKFNVVGEWAVYKIDPIRPEIFDKELSLKFPTPFIEFESNGKMNWHEWILMEARPSETKYHGTYIIKDDKITISAPGNAWMNGTHTIEKATKNNIVLIVETSSYKAKVTLTPSGYDL